MPVIVAGRTIMLAPTGMFCRCGKVFELVGYGFSGGRGRDENKSF